MLREERYGELGSGKWGIGRDLNYFLATSMGNFERTIEPLRSVFKLKAFGCVILGGADFLSRYLG